MGMGGEWWPWKGGTPGTREEVPVPAGQGVLWSIGTDRVDDRGTVATTPVAYNTRSYGDLVYLVPRPPKKR